MKSFQTVRKVRGSAMKIKQVEELVGITRKNIRFYEDQGLLNVERAENGYREYHQEDVIRLQEIKLFRKMDISIEEMKLLFEKKKSLQICLEQHLKELEHRKEGLLKMQDMCERLILEHRSLESLNAEDCLEEIEQMEKEGAKFMNVNKTDVHKKKRTGAIVGAAVMTVLMLVTIIIVFWANAQDPIPLGLLLLIAGIPAVIIAGTLIALAGRMKTLVGGEIVGYTEMLNEARQIATKRMVDEAKEMDADAVIGVKYGSSQVMSGAAEVIAYGTAVKYK